MPPIVADGVVWSVGCSVSLSVTIVSPAKMAELIEILFGLWTREGPRNYILGGGQDLPIRRGNFEGEGAACCKV